MKRESMGWEKRLAIYVSDKDLISKYIKNSYNSIATK